MMELKKGDKPNTRKIKIFKVVNEDDYDADEVFGSREEAVEYILRNGPWEIQEKEITIKI